MSDERRQCRWSPVELYGLIGTIWFCSALLYISLVNPT